MKAAGFSAEPNHGPAATPNFMGHLPGIVTLLTSNSSGTRHFSSSASQSPVASALGAAEAEVDKICF